MITDRVLSLEEATLLGRAFVEPTSRTGLDDIDLELIRKLAPAIDRLIGGYFRMEVEGLEQVPEGPLVIVGNHNTGVSFVEPFGLGARWYLRRGFDDPIRALAHDTILRVPLVGNLLRRAGVVRASPYNAFLLLERGEKVLVFPGGEKEAYRTFRQRNSIQFYERKGFLKLALRARVPLQPLVTVGGQETFCVLNDGQKLARWLRTDRLLRLGSFPIFLGLPYGIGIGPIFHFPLPAKVQFRFLEPLHLECYRPEQAADPELLDELYWRVVEQMQRAMDELVARRRFPILG